MTTVWDKIEVWDKNGACNQCGYMPFVLSEFCTECNERQKIISVKTIKLSEIAKLQQQDDNRQDINYLQFKNINIDDEEKYMNCPLTNMKNYGYEEPLVKRIQKIINRIKTNNIKNKK